MKLLYLAAPYAAPTAAGVERNRTRARIMAEYAVRLGFCPVYTHDMPIYGGSEDVPGVRDRALAHGLALAEWVAKSGGQMWVLTRDDDSISDGCRAETERFMVQPIEIRGRVQQFQPFYALYLLGRNVPDLAARWQETNL